MPYQNCKSNMHTEPAYSSHRKAQTQPQIPLKMEIKTRISQIIVMLHLASLLNVQMFITNLYNKGCSNLKELWEWTQEVSFVLLCGNSIFLAGGCDKFGLVVIHFYYSAECVQFNLIRLFGCQGSLSAKLFRLASKIVYLNRRVMLFLIVTPRMMEYKLVI